MLYTRRSVQENIRNREGKRVFYLGKGDQLTSDARDWLTRERIPILPAEQAKPQQYQLLGGGILTEKPEHMTHLSGNTLVSKTHPRIAFRGAMDMLQAQLLLCINDAPETVKKQLQQVLDTARKLLSREVMDEKVLPEDLGNMTEKEIRERSHRPQDFYGQPHFMPSGCDSQLLLQVNLARTYARQAELAAVRAFLTEEGLHREDLVRGMNRLSSALYLIMIQLKKRKRGVMMDIEEVARQVIDKLFVPMEASGRHVHITKEQAQTLFGHPLTPARELSQPGQFLANERVTVIGPKGRFQNVAVLGPERPEGQVEISLTDGKTLGIQPPVRLSGDVKDTPGVILSAEHGQVALKQGVIAAKRHIHMNEADARRFGVKDKQTVKLQTITDRPVVFDQVMVRVHPSFETSVHLDYDEANACGFQKGDLGRILQ